MIGMLPTGMLLRILCSVFFQYLLLSTLLLGAWMLMMVNVYSFVCSSMICILLWCVGGILGCRGIWTFASMFFLMIVAIPPFLFFLQLGELAMTVHLFLLYRCFHSSVFNLVSWR